MVGGSVPSYQSLISTNQWTSQIVAFTVLTKSVSNESVFFTQKPHPHRAFLRNCMRAESVCSIATSITTRGPSSIRAVVPQNLVYALYLIHNDVTHQCIKCWKYKFYNPVNRSVILQQPPLLS